MITLNNGILRVEIAEPGEHPNDRARFDRAGFITEVVLNNELRFCANENRNNRHPTTFGRGLCCEFKLNTSEMVKVGERYPKLGVGLILKEKDEPYRFFESYNIEYFPIDCSSDGTTAVFHTHALPCIGYAAEHNKKVSIEGNTLTIDFEIINTGEKEIETEEYCHNFINIDGYSVGPDYLLETPMLRDFGSNPITNRSTGEPSKLTGCGKGFTYSDLCSDIILAPIDTEGMSGEIPFKWKLSNKAACASISAEDYYTPTSIVFWTTDHLIAPEFIQTIRIKPGESYSWTRKMTFTDER